MTAINSNRAIRGPVTAVPVVAGKGVRLTADTVNNRWVVEADETVLYESNTAVQQGNTFTLSETPNNFDSVKIYLVHNENNTAWSQVFEYPGIATRYDMVLYACDQSSNLLFDKFYYSRSGTTVTVGLRKRHNLSTAAQVSDLTYPSYIMKVVGVNRIASN